jgi:hypothetical protein
MNRVSFVIALGAALGAACSDPTSTALTQLNLDRPVDISFACFGGMRVTNGRTTGATTDPITTTAQPAASCETRSLAHNLALPASVPPGQEDLTASGGLPVGTAYWFGFILQSAAGTVAIAQWPSKSSEEFVVGDVSVLDADPLTPGKNSISVGEDPIAIATDKTGCYEVTANAGSCDLSELEINSALDQDPTTPVKVTRVPVKNAAGTPILAKPAAMVAEPNTDVVGNTCAATPSGVVYVAYPSCHLVAAVDMSTGTIVSGIQYTATGPAVLKDPELATVTCPAECADAKGALGSIMPGTRPVTLALELDPRVKTKRLVIGADNSASFAVVELGPDSLPQSFSQIALQDPTGKLGLTSIALSPQLGLGGTTGVINDDASGVTQAQYVYAVATDNTVRVADVLSLNRECDTQVDSRFVRTIRSVSPLQCFRVGDPATPPRRAGAKGPGIELLGDGVPTSVTFFKAPPLETSTPTPGPTTLVGYFAIIAASNGASFVVNVDDDSNAEVNGNGDLFQQSAPQLTAPTLIIAHQLRDNVVDRGGVASTKVNAGETPKPSCLDPGPNADVTGGNAAGPRSTTAPARNVTGGPVAGAKVAELPLLRQLRCTADDAKDGVAVSEVQFAADPQTRDQVFPDLRSLDSDETWTATYEGPLSQDTNLTSIDGPVVRSGLMTIDPMSGSMHLKDPTQPFCAMGAELFDIVQFRGCNSANGDADCPSAYQCYVHPDSQVAIGACMLRSEASRLANACRDFLTSLRRYTVGKVTSGELVLLPRKHELRTTPIDGCTTDAQCEALADYAVRNASAADPVHDVTLPDPHTWACRADDARAPNNNADPAQSKRCIETCTSTADCDVGTICQGGVCLEGVTPPQSCVNGPQRFDVRASEAFTVVGSRHGYIHSIVDKGAPTHECSAAVAPATGSLQVGRIPLNPRTPVNPLDPTDLRRVPALCDPTADPITGKLPGGGFEPNPCSLNVTQVENQPVYPNLASRDCTLGTPQVVLAERSAPAVKFRNPALKLTIVDPTYPGDEVCLLDRNGKLGQIPLVFPGFQLSFHQTAGFTPLTLPISPSFPVKVVHGPTNSIWVIDDGDYLSTSVIQASTRGKVFRLESTNLTLINLLQ